MTRKRYIKMLMAAGADRNTANTWAENTRATGYEYGEVANMDRDSVEIFARSLGRGKLPLCFRPHKSKRRQRRWVFVDEWETAGGGGHE